MLFATTTAAARAALLGVAVGDALGVPVEFAGRDARRRDPVLGMRAYGTHHQPAGTWSDDSSLTFCLAETLARPGALDLDDFARRAINWLDNAYWTAHGRVFDVGNATRQAIYQLQRGVAPTKAGPRSEDSNGNGALMRILPLVFHPIWQAEALDLNAAWALTEAVASVTHGHPRSSLGCFLYLLVARGLLAGLAPAAACDYMRKQATEWLATAAPPAIVEEQKWYSWWVLSGKLVEQPEDKISSSGYVVHTLEAALWCLLRYASYPETVLAAVNLGDDTDTTGAVAGGLAGLAYGEAAIPAEWLAVLAGHADIENLAARLGERYTLSADLTQVQRERHRYLRQHLSPAPYGPELAAQVAAALARGSWFNYGHPAYCGMGFDLVEGQYRYGPVWEGALEPDLTFPDAAAFSDWLAQQSDLALALLDSPDHTLWHNQTVTRPRLLELVQPPDPAAA